MKGFTLIELLVVSGIVILLTALIIPGWRAGEGSLAIERAASKIEQDIRRAVELSQHAKWYACTPNPPERIAGYGIYFDVNIPQSYFIFADCNNNQKYDSGTDGLVETIAVESPAKISSATQGAFQITIVPPDPTFFIKNTSGGTITGNVEIILFLENSSQTKTITINQKGVVSIQ